jgi:hypothetical protein
VDEEEAVVDAEEGGVGISYRGVHYQHIPVLAILFSKADHTHPLSVLASEQPRNTWRNCCLATDDQYLYTSPSIFCLALRRLCLARTGISCVAQCVCLCLFLARLACRTTYLSGSGLY